MNMDPHLIRIVEGITMQDLKTGKITWIEVYKKQVEEWFFKPIRILSKDDKNFSLGMSMFALEMIFFESHGQYLLGKSSHGMSKKTFNYAMEKFIGYLIKQKRAADNISNILSDQLYKKIRCGLFHSGYICDGFLVDSIRSRELSFYKISTYNGWLVNPWELIKDLENYFQDYTTSVENDIKLKENFDKMFKAFFYALGQFKK